VQKRLDIAPVPELRTGAGMHGSLKQKAGGPICTGVPVAIIYAACTLRVEGAGGARSSPPPFHSEGVE
jgi:hypothetical protein